MEPKPEIYQLRDYPGKLDDALFLAKLKQERDKLGDPDAQRLLDRIVESFENRDD